MYKKVGFIGSGNIASALIGGIIKKGYLSPENIFTTDIHKEKIEAITQNYGVTGIEDNISLARECEVIVLTVKPNKYEAVLNEIKNHITMDMLIVSPAAGVSMSYVKKFLGAGTKIIRTMPSTPAFIGQGITAISYNDAVESYDIDFAKGMFSSVGVVEVVDESQIDAFTSVYSSSPAFVDMIIEAMVDAAEFLGLQRSESYMLAAHAVKGAAEMVIETKMHPGELKDMVCSPEGTAIEGVRYLEEKGIRSTVMEALIITAYKARAMGEKYK